MFTALCPISCYDWSCNSENWLQYGISLDMHSAGVREISAAFQYNIPHAWVVTVWPCSTNIISFPGVKWRVAIRNLIEHRVQSSDTYVRHLAEISFDYWNSRFLIYVFVISFKCTVDANIFILIDGNYRQLRYFFSIKQKSSGYWSTF